MQKIISLLFISLILFSQNCWADSDIYSANVSVDITADNAVIAKEKALAEANRKALMAIAGKITTEEGTKKLAALTDEQILNFIKETAVISEKASVTRYIASLKIYADENILKTYMNEQGIPMALDEIKTAIIIPVYRDTQASSPLLWEDENPWRQEWENKLVKKGMTTFKAIPSSLNGFIDTKEALRLDGIAFGQVAQYTSTRDIYVAEYIPTASGAEVKISSYKGGLLGTIQAENMRDAMSKVVTKISDSLKKQSITQSTYSSEFVVLYNNKNLKDWVDTEKKIKSIPYVSNVEVVAMGGGKVQFKILFSGSRENLFRALRDNLLNMEQHGDFYLLTRLQ